jgi:hypothetical protein
MYSPIHEFIFGKFYERHTRNDIYLYILHCSLRSLEVKQFQAKIFLKAERKNESYREIKTLSIYQFILIMIESNLISLAKTIDSVINT